MLATFTNGRVTLMQNLIYGLCVLSDRGPFPLNQLSLEEIDLVLVLINGNPTCPEEYTKALSDYRKALVVRDQPKCPYCGLRTETPCDSAPPDTCEHALNNTHT